MTLAGKQPRLTGCVDFKTMNPKMATENIAGELMQLLSPYNYTDRIQHLSNKEVFAQKLFMLTELSETHWLDMRKCYHHRCKNSNQVFELFGSFNNENPVQVRKDMIQHICDNRSFYANVGQEHLKCIKLTIDQWILLMSSDSVFGDELMIFALSRVYQRHTVIFTSRSCWTTIGMDELIDGNRLLQICQVHLLHIALQMYAEIKSKPFVPVTKTAVTEAPFPVLPALNDDSSATDTAIDLSIKHSYVKGDEASTTAGEPSDTPFETQPEQIDVTSHYQINSDVSDSISDSLLPSNPIVSKHTAADTIGINNKEIIPPIEQERIVALNHVPDNSVLGTNNSENTNNLSPCTNIMENSTCAVMGTNINMESDHLEIEIGLNTEDNVSNCAVQDISLNDGENITSDLSCIHSDVEQRNTPIHSHANPKSNPYDDALLSGALEKLSIAEWTVANALLTLSCITENYVQRGSGNDQAANINSKHSPTPAKEITDETNDQNVTAGQNQVTDTWNLPTELTNAMHTVDPNPDSSDHSYCTIKNKNGPVADASLVPTLQENDYVLEIIDTTSKVPILQMSDSDIQIDMTSHDLMLNPFTSNLPEQPVLGINSHADQTTDILTAKCEVGISSPGNYPDETDGDNLKSELGINNPIISEVNIDLQMVQNINKDNPCYTNTSSCSDIMKNMNMAHTVDAGITNESLFEQHDNSSSSEFEGFHSDVLIPSTTRIHNDSNSSSDEHTNSDFEYEDVIEDSSDTIPEIENQPSIENTNDLQDLFLVRNQTIDAHILKMWEADAKTKKWEILLHKLTSREVYDLSHPPPKWDKIDPYLGLEEDSDESSKNQPITEINIAHASNSKYGLRKRANTGKVTRKSNRISGK